MKHLKRTLIAAATAAAFSTSAGVQAAVLLDFNFENFAVGQISGGHSAAVAGLAGTHNMANNGAEDFGFFSPNGKLSMTRFFGAVNMPVLTFTTASTISLDSISFLHIHNHNPGFPTSPDYDVRLQIDTGSGFTNLATFLAAPGGPSVYHSESIAGPGVLGPGTYALRWQGFGFTGGADSNTEFFGLDNIRLNGSVVPVPATLALVGLGLAGLGWSRGRNAAA